MDAAATMTSKGQVTVPKAVRDALDLHAGDEVVFRVEENRAILTKTSDFLARSSKEMRAVVMQKVQRVRPLVS